MHNPKATEPKLASAEQYRRRRNNYDRIRGKKPPQTATKGARCVGRRYTEPDQRPACNAVERTEKAGKRQSSWY